MKNGSQNGLLRWATIALLALLCVCLCMIPNSVFATNSLDETNDSVQNEAALEEEVVIDDPPVTDAPEEEPAAEPAEEETVPSETAAAEENVAVTEPESEEPAPAEPEFPAQSIDDTTDTGVKVTVSAEEGVLPAESSVTVRELTDEEAAPYRAVLEEQGVALDNVRFLDVTILDSNDKEVEPNDNGEVEVSFSGLGFASDADLVVYHFADEENQPKPGWFNFIKKGHKPGAPERITPDKKRNGKISFTTKHFSVYVIVDSGEDARLTAVFHRADGTTESQQINKRQLDKIEQYIFDPGAGTPEGAFFKGWTTVKNYTATTTPVLTIEDVREDIAARLNVEGGIQDGTTVDYYAMVFHSYVITYLDEDGITIKNDQVLYPVGDSTTHQYTVDLTYVPKYAYDTTSGASREFGGWQQIAPEVSGLQIYQNEDKFDLTSDVTLRATIQTGYWLIFDANLNNASFTVPVFAPFVNGQPGAPSSEPEDPTCPGYTFQGWFTGSPAGNGEVEGGTEVNFNEPLTATTTVYGVWTQNDTATYHVIIWQQSLAGGNNYDYKETITVNNYTVGNNTLQINERNNTTARIYTSNTQFTDKSYPGFHVGNIDAQKPVEADNTTVINVYFDRNSHTFTFRRNNQTIHTVTRLYGQDISDIWSFTGSDGRTYPQTNPPTSWQPSGSSTYTARITRMEVMPDEDITFTHTTTNNTTRYFHYYVEALPGATNTRTYNGTQYSLYVDLTHDFNRIYYNDDFWNLDGFDRVAIATANGTNVTSSIQNAGDGGKSWENSWNNNLYFYYSRKDYSIEYEDGTFFDLTWDSAAGSSKEVPLPDPPVSQNIDTKTGIKYEQNINNTTYNFTPTKTEYVFAGWYKDVNCTDPYTFGTMPSNNFKLYAKWLSKVYKVSLVPNDTTADPIRFVDPNQSRSFYVNCNEKIADMSGAERNYWELVGWYTDSGFTHSYDFAVIPVNDAYIAQYGDPEYREPDWAATYGQITLYARWRSKLVGSDGIKVEYDITDKGTGTAPTDGNNYVDHAEAIAATACTAADPDTYVFSHWNVQHWNGTDYADSGVSVYPGEIFEVKIDDSQIVNTDTSEVVPRDQYDSLNPEGHYSYTVKLKAVYVEKDKEITTFINWYNNYDGGGLFDKSENIKINEAVTIPDAPTRTGYKFLGWIRGIEEDGTTTTLTDLWLEYKADRLGLAIPAAGHSSLTDSFVFVDRPPEVLSLRRILLINLEGKGFAFLHIAVPENLAGRRLPGHFL